MEMIAEVQRTFKEKLEHFDNMPSSNNQEQAEKEWYLRDHIHDPMMPYIRDWVGGYIAAINRERGFSLRVSPLAWSAVCTMCLMEGVHNWDPKFHVAYHFDFWCKATINKILNNKKDRAAFFGYEHKKYVSKQFGGIHFGVVDPDRPDVIQREPEETWQYLEIDKIAITTGINRRLIKEYGETGVSREICLAYVMSGVTPDSSFVIERFNDPRTYTRHRRFEEATDIADGVVEDVTGRRMKRKKKTN